jgi:hypothetical protein
VSFLLKIHQYLQLHLQVAQLARVLRVLLVPVLVQLVLVLLVPVLVQLVLVLLVLVLLVLVLVLLVRQPQRLLPLEAWLPQL